MEVIEINKNSIDAIVYLDFFCYSKTRTSKTSKAGNETLLIR